MLVIFWRHGNNFRNGKLQITHTSMNFSRAKAGFVIFATANTSFLFGDIMIKGYSMNVSSIDLYFIKGVWLYDTDLVKG